jgi:hypothetical protein
MIFDAFIFRDEFDCLEIRLHELSSVVDHFVLVEGDLTFQGNPKALEFEKRKEEFTDWPIVHVAVTDWPITDDPWVREAHQRNAILHGIFEAADEDMVLISDADEIPRPSAVKAAEKRLKQGSFQVGFEQALYFYQVNNRCEMPWHGTQAMTAAGCRMRNPEGARSARSITDEVKNAGWHFCNLGDVDWLIDKIESFSHTEVNEPHIKDREHLEKCIEQGLVIDGRTDMEFELDDEGLPAYLLENPERLSRLFA